MFLSVPETNPNIFQVWRNDFPEEKNLTLAIFTGSKIPQTILQSVSCSMAATFHRTVVELVFTLSQVMYCIHSKPFFFLLQFPILNYLCRRLEQMTVYISSELFCISFNPFAGYFLLVHIKIGRIYHNQNLW